MKTHALRGRDIIDQMLRNCAMDGSPHVGLLRNIIAYHHEAMNGTGYPDGRSGNNIPIEARITAVADMVRRADQRPPLQGSMGQRPRVRHAQGNLRRKAQRRVHIEALLNHREEVEEIQKSFREDALG